MSLKKKRSSHEQDAYKDICNLYYHQIYSKKSHSIHPAALGTPSFVVVRGRPFAGRLERQNSPDWAGMLDWRCVRAECCVTSLSSRTFSTWCALAHSGDC